MSRTRCVWSVTMILLCAPGVIAQTEKRATATQKPKGIKIGLIDNSKGQYQDGCGCGFWPVRRQPGFDDSWKNKAYLIGNYDKQAWMNIDGETVKLRLIKNTTKYTGRKGDRYYQTYKSASSTVVVTCVATGFGDTHAVYCDSTITVIKGSQKQTVKAKGDCGC